MLTVSLFSPPAPAPAPALSVSSLSIYDNNINNKNFLSLQNIAHQSLFLVPRSSCSLKYNPFRVSIDQKGKIAMNKNRRGFGAVCYAAPLTSHNIQWISAICSAVLMFAKGTAVHKSFLVPLFALQAPAGIISWMKGEYGIWAAFLALLVRLFFSIPGELELPFLALLLVIVAPYQVMKLRGTQEGAIIALVIAGYLAFQHFSWAGSLRKAFDQGSIVPTLAIICITALSCLLLI